MEFRGIHAEAKGRYEHQRYVRLSCTLTHSHTHKTWGSCWITDTVDYIVHIACSLPAPPAWCLWLMCSQSYEAGGGYSERGRTWGRSVIKSVQACDALRYVIPIKGHSSLLLLNCTHGWVCRKMTCCIMVGCVYNMVGCVVRWRAASWLDVSTTCLDPSTS